MSDILYVKNENKMIYKATIGEDYYTRRNSNVNSNTYFTVDLELVAGVDYINPDTNDIQGYVKPNRFIEEVQYENFTVYLLDETIKQRLEDEGYTIIEELPTIN